jgi:transposase-like protein
MRRYSEAIKADVRRRMSPPNRQSVAQIYDETGIHAATLYLWRKGWRLEGEVVPASQKDPEGWGATSQLGEDESAPPEPWRQPPCQCGSAPHCRSEAPLG